MQTVEGLVTWVNKSYARGDWYLNGGYFDRIVTLDYIMEKARQYPKRYTPEYIERSKKAIGKYAGDCVCFVKAYIWTDENGKIRYPTDPKVKAETDINVDDAFEQSPLKGSISTIPEIPGICVYYQGHMGIYIGKGYVIEARGVDYGVVKTKLTSRDWTHWFYYPGIIYEESNMYLEKGVKSEEVGIWQRYLKSRGYDLGNYGPNKDGIDNSFGGAMVTIQTKWEQDNKRTVDSKVDLSDCLFALNKISNELLTANTLLSKERERVMFLDAEIAERQSMLSKAEDELFIAYQKTADIEAKLSNKLSELETIRKQLLDALKRVSDLELMIDNLEDSNVTLKEQVDAANTENINLQVENERLREELKNAELPLPFEPEEDEPDYSIADLLKMIVDRIFKKN